MCNSVIAGGREFNTPRELASLVGGEENLVWKGFNPFARWSEGKDWRDLDLCLCGIDLPATLERAALSWHRGVDPFEHFVD